MGLYRAPPAYSEIVKKETRAEETWNPIFVNEEDTTGSSWCASLPLLGNPLISLYYHMGFSALLCLSLLNFRRYFDEANPDALHDLTHVITESGILLINGLFLLLFVLVVVGVSRASTVSIAAAGILVYIAHCSTISFSISSLLDLAMGRFEEPLLGWCWFGLSILVILWITHMGMVLLLLRDELMENEGKERREMKGIIA